MSILKETVVLHVATGPWLDVVIRSGQSTSKQRNLDTGVNVIKRYFPGDILYISEVWESQNENFVTPCDRVIVSKMVGRWDVLFNITS
jgi:hypothetical protein